MPQINTAEIQEHQIYGQSDIDVTMTMRERLMTRFKAHELVEVENIDNEKFEWQFLPDHAEQSTLTDDGIKITYRDDPELWELEAGSRDFITGSCAYHMIEGLVKKMIIKQVGIVERPQHSKDIHNFNFKDPIRVEQFIDKIFKGKVSPSFNQLQPNKVVPVKPIIKPKKQVVLPNKVV